MARLLYNLLLHLALPWVLLRLWWRGRREPGYRADWAQRFGRYTEAPPSPPPPPLIWVHAVSLGETLAAAPLVTALRARYPQHRLLLTHMTATGRAAAQGLYAYAADRPAGPDQPWGEDHQVRLAWLPYDLPWSAARFFDHFAPVLGIVMETEVWPNLTRAAVQRGVPLLLANARLSEKSALGYRRALALLQPAFGAFAVGAQTEATPRVCASSVCVRQASPATSNSIPLRPARRRHRVRRCVPSSARARCFWPPVRALAKRRCCSMRSIGSMHPSGNGWINP